MVLPTAPTELSSPAVPPELVGREVSVRALVPLWQAVQAKGVDPEQLVIGTGYALAHLRNPRARISWPAFFRFMSNMGELFDDDELVAAGSRTLDSPLFRALLLPGRLLFGVIDTYRWVFGPNGPPSQLFAAHHGRLRELAPGLLQLDMRMSPGYAPSRENYLLMRGLLMNLSCVLGAGPAEVTLQSVSDGATFQIRVRETRGALSSLRGLFAWMFAAKSAGEELRRAHLELYERYVELQREIEARGRIEVERQHLEEQLRQAQKMEAVGRLAGGVAHDFNNLLSIILSYSSILIDRTTPHDPMRTDLQEIQKAGQRAASLTRQLLAFSRQQVVQARVLDLNQIIRDMENMIRHLVGEDVELTIVSQPGLGKVKADPVHLEQVIMNIVVNARDAMPQGGKLTIETANVELDQSYAEDHLGVVPGPHVMLAIRDTGIGMDDTVQARMFEPFFTTKAKDKGTGLGLSTVFGIVKQSAGSIWVYSEPGRGSAFKVYLPETNASELHAVPRPLVGSERGSETILVVDDEEQIRVVTRGILERNGYSVLDAASAAEALLVCTSHQGALDLLLTDVIMPEMGGRELADRVVAMQPGIQVIFMSGYTDDVLVRDGALNAELVFLQKPIRSDTLLQKVREVLDASRCAAP
jgi:signal transduction histidine kinase/ActR/RegA family two-component response regulator